MFIERLMEEKNFGDIKPETRGQIKEDLLGRVEDRINATILENIPAEKMEEFSRLIEAGDAESVQVYCQKNIPDLDNVIAEALVSFRSTYLNS